MCELDRGGGISIDAFYLFIYLECSRTYEGGDDEPVV